MAMEARQIHIKDGKKQYFICVDDILFALADINYTDIYLTQHTVYKTIRIQIGQLWKLIEEVKPANSHTLARIGRSHIINLKYLQYADPKKKTITLHTTKDVVLEKVPKAAVESLLMLIDKDKRREVLSVYSQRMKLKVSIEDLNDEHLEIDGKVYVDLGLPSGTLWSTLNHDARDAEDCGHYTYFDWDQALCAEDKNWRLPTNEQFHELFDECLRIWCTSANGEKGVLLTGPNGNRIFLVAAGCKRNGEMTREHGTLSGYWTSTSLGEHQAVAIEMKEDEDASNIADGVNLIESYEEIMDSYQVRLIHSPIPSLQDK